MKERWAKELKMVEAKLGSIEVAPDLSWFIIKRVPLPKGWSKAETAVLIFVPSGYPITPPDNFFADGDLRLASGALPDRANPDTQVGRSWIRFSFHVEGGWDSKADPETGHNLVTFVLGALKRLSEVD